MLLLASSWARYMNFSVTEIEVERLKTHSSLCICIPKKTEGLQTEAAILIEQALETMTESEIHAVMTAGL